MDKILEHHFRIDIAERVGVNAAIIYNSIVWWCSTNKDAGKHYYDEHWWMFHPRSAWVKSFPYLSDKSIQTAIEKLIDAGLIIKGNYNADKFDRTNWYALADESPLTISGQSTTPKCLEDSVSPLTTSGQSIDHQRSVNIVNDNIVNESLVKNKKNKNNARAREAIIADIKTENQLWIDNMMMHHKVESENEVLELAAWGYDQVALKGNEPTRGDIMKYCNAHVSDWREYKRREAIKAIPINDRRMALWEEVCKYREEYSYTIRFNWTERMVKPSKSDPDIMIFEEQPGLNVPVELNKYKLRYEQRNQYTAL